IEGCYGRRGQSYRKTRQKRSGYQDYSRCCWNEAEKEIYSGANRTKIILPGQENDTAWPGSDASSPGPLMAATTRLYGSSGTTKGGHTISPWCRMTITSGTIAAPTVPPSSPRAIS